MKKIILAVTAVALLLNLTACEVHWYHKTYDVPWYVIAIPVVAFSMIMFAIAGTVISGKRYTCPICGHRFHPSFWVAVVSIHVGSDRYFKCPRCGKRSFCPPARPSDDD